MDKNLAEMTLGFVHVASLATKKAVDSLQLHETAQKRAQASQPALLDYMVTHGLIPAADKAAAAAMLGGHAETLEMLKSACEQLVELRQAVAVKTASVPSPGRAVPAEKSAAELNNNPTVGIRTSAMKESDRVLSQIMNAPGG